MVAVEDREFFNEDLLSDVEEGVSIPLDNMGRISSLVSDHALEFPRNV
jgi:hypothetical protein